MTCDKRLHGRSGTGRAAGRFTLFEVHGPSLRPGAVRLIQTVLETRYYVVRKLRDFHPLPAIQLIPLELDTLLVVGSELAAVEDAQKLVTFAMLGKQLQD